MVRCTRASAQLLGKCHLLFNRTEKSGGEEGDENQNKQSTVGATRKRPNTLSYVITNPSPKRKLRVGDIVYMLQPSSMYAKPSKHKLYLGHRSQSYTGPTVNRSYKAAVDAMLTSLGDDTDSPKCTGSLSNKPEDLKETKVGRFNLRRIVSERPADDTTSNPPSPSFLFVDANDDDQKDVLDSRL